MVVVGVVMGCCGLPSLLIDLLLPETDLDGGTNYSKYYNQIIIPNEDGNNNKSKSKNKNQKGSHRHKAPSKVPIIYSPHYNITAWGLGKDDRQE